MEDDEIKHEFGGDDRHQCNACLSVGRLLRPLQDLASIYMKITSKSCIGSLESIQLCWQCISLLKKVVLFQGQVKKADELLQTNQNFIYSLSNLTSVTLNQTHQKIYLYEGNIQTNIEPNTAKNSNTKESKTESKDTLLNDNSDFEENTEIPKQKINKSRWSIKKAEQNKKPKFKVCTDFDKSFQKIQITEEELLQCIDRERNSDHFKSKKFKCNECVLVFLTKNKYKLHRKLHSIQKYTCDICKCILSEKELISHMRKHFYVYKCVVCQFVCRKWMRNCHFKKEHKRVIECVKCKMKFGNRRIFYKHYKEWHEKYICDQCGTTFKMRYCIEDHIRKQHSPFECKPCSKTFARYNGLWLHNKLVHRPASPAFCTDCGTTYPDVYRLKWHLCSSVRHVSRNKLRIPCTACDKIFTKKIYMTDHYNLVHLKVYKYRCEACDKNFVRNADLMKHKRKIHEGILPPKNKMCYICGRGFTTNKILQNHVRTHTGERPFRCECGATFSQRAAMCAHARTHRIDTATDNTNVNVTSKF